MSQESHGLHALRMAIDVAEKARDEAVRQLARAQGQKQSAVGQLEQLQAYGSETTQRWMGRAQQGASTSQMATHYQFSAKLDQAILFQQDVVGNQGARIEQLRQRLSLADQRLSGLKRLEAARMASLNKAADRREQMQMDELASRRHRSQIDNEIKKESEWASN